jgi:hypothetical protein
MKLRQHFHGVLALWNEFRDLNTINIRPQITQNLGNLNSVLEDACGTESSDALQNFHGILFLNDFCGRVHQTYSPLIHILSTQISHRHNHPIFGDYLIGCFESSAWLPLPDAESQITLGEDHFCEKSPLQQGGPILLIFVVLKLISFS